jgi:hypothetical protein
MRGTSPGAVLFAMYPFRLEAALVVDHVSLGERLGRLGHLAGVGLLSGAPLVLAALLLAVLAARRPWRSDRSEESSLRSAVGIATLALAAYGLVSVVAGGSYWLHYLVQLVVPTALAAGLVAASLPRPGRSVLVVVLASSAVAWSTGLIHRTPAQGQATGTAIGRVAEPGDTVVTAFGDASMLRTADLESPYPYLWSIPARTLDPGFTDLGALLEGRHAPTWFVVRGPGTLGALERGPVGIPLRARYERVAEVCGRMVYLRRDVSRPAPRPGGGCREPVSTWFVDDDR